MRRLSQLWLMAIWLAAAPSWASDVNMLRDLTVSDTDAATTVMMTGTRAPAYTVFRLHEPERLVVDVAEADATSIKGHHEGRGNIVGVVASQFVDAQAQLGRILVTLKEAVPYEVKSVGNRLLVSVQKKNEVALSTEVRTKVTHKLSESDAESSSPGAPVQPLTSAQAKPLSRKVTKLGLGPSGLQITADGVISKFEVLELNHPPRLALDVYGFQWGGRVPQGVPPVRELRVGPHADRVRIVLDLEGAIPKYKAALTPKGMELRWLKDGADSEVNDAVAEIDGRAIQLEESSRRRAIPVLREEQDTRVVTVRDLTLAASPEGGTLNLLLSGETTWQVEKPDNHTAVLTLDSARLAPSLERSLDTQSMATPLKMVSSFAVPGTVSKARIVVSGEGDLRESVEKHASGLLWRLKFEAPGAEEISVVRQVAGATAEESPTVEEAPVAKAGRYSGKKVSFEFKDIDLHNLLRIIAEVSKKNIVVADDVTGKVTIRLRNVPWDQALELILRSKSLGQEDLGNIIRVAPLRALEEEAKLREERKKSIQRQEELLVQLIPVNYAAANDMAARVKEILSERGTVTVDVRTNTLIIRDILSSIGRARSLVKSLDTPTPQVLIESRIVEANTNFTRQVGIQWGGNAQMAQSTGNSTGLIFPNTVVARGGSSSEGSDGTGTPPNFAVNLPAAVGTGAGGALGFVFGSAGGALALNLRLSALENQGVVKTISAPKVTTLDNSPARISQGVSIPFSQVSAGGVNTTFVEARLSLDVTPHITSDGSILMTIKAENNQPDPGNTGANGQPSIQRKEANTQVLVRDGDTTVIGGIYVRRGANNSREIPFLSKIPILGFFFKSVSETDTRQELLIFITPRIIHQQMTAQNP